VRATKANKDSKANKDFILGILGIFGIVGCLLARFIFSGLMPQSVPASFWPQHPGTHTEQDQYDYSQQR